MYPEILLGLISLCVLKLLLIILTVFFPFCVNEWNTLNKEIRTLKSVSVFKKSLLKNERQKKSPVFNILDFQGLKLLTWLRLNFSHLREHKFNHSFQDTISPPCSCSLETESTSHFLMRCFIFSSYRRTLLDNVIEIVGSISNLTDSGTYWSTSLWR